jgi:RNA polymerase sigma factor (sigma-70 family)
MSAAVTLNASAFAGSHALKADEGQRQPEIAAMTRAMVRGDEAAWVRFHAAYSGRVHRYLLVLLRGQEDIAAELLQVTLTRVARHIRSFDEEPIFGNWLARIARTVVIDELRKVGARDGMLQRLEAVPPESTGDNESWAEWIEAGLRQLEPDDRDLLARKYLEGAAVRELAVELGVSEKAIESRLGRAREKLRLAVLELVKREQ